MNLVVAFLVVALAVSVAVTVMLLVRRRAPEGSYFKDGDRASGVFGVIATGFSVLLGFIVFLAFTSYDSSRAGAESEARAIAQQIQTAQFFDESTASKLTGQLVCYARWVAGPEWEEMAVGGVEEGANRWGAVLFRTTRAIDPVSAVDQSAYDKWLDETSDRQAARQDRIHGAAGVIPTPLWIVLLAISLIVFTYMLFFADPSEGAVTQSVLMGSVVAIISMLLLLLVFLDHPFDSGVGQLKPTAMERTLEIAASEIRVANIDVTIPCDADGRPR